MHGDCTVCHEPDQSKYYYARKKLCKKHFYEQVRANAKKSNTEAVDELSKNLMDIISSLQEQVEGQNSLITSIQNKVESQNSLITSLQKQIESQNSLITSLKDKPDSSHTASKTSKEPAAKTVISKYAAEISKIKEILNTYKKYSVKDLRNFADSFDSHISTSIKQRDEFEVAFVETITKLLQRYEVASKA
jgi:hypothetical protein